MKYTEFLINLETERGSGAQLTNTVLPHLTYTNINNTRGLVYQWFPEEKIRRKVEGKKKPNYQTGYGQGNLGSKRQIFTKFRGKNAKKIGLDSDTSINNIPKYKKIHKKETISHSSKKAIDPNSNRSIHKKQRSKYPNLGIERTQSHNQSKRSIDGISQQISSRPQKAPPSKFTQKQTKRMLSVDPKTQMEILLKEKQEICDVLKNKNVTTLIQKLRFPVNDDSDQKRVTALYSLGSYIRRIVETTVRNNKNLLVGKLEANKDDSEDEEFPAYSENDPEVGDIKPSKDLDRTSPGPGLNSSSVRKGMASITSPSRGKVSLSNRFLFSPNVQSRLANRLSTRKIISDGGYSIAYTRGTSGEIKEHLNESVYSEEETLTRNDSNTTKQLNKVNSRSFLNEVRNRTVGFMDTFMKENSQMAIVASMMKTNRRKWLEKKTNLNFHQNAIHMLIADDSHKQIETIEQIMSSSNVVIDSAADGNQAFDRVKAKAKDGLMYHLILMDVHMPNCDGSQASLRIRKFEDEMKVTKRNHIVAISADDHDLMIGRTKESKMNSFIQKPISLPILHGVLTKRTKELKCENLLVL